MDNKSTSTALMFINGFNLERIAHGYTRLSQSDSKSIFQQIFKAFAKKQRISEIPLPDLTHLQQYISTNKSKLFSLYFYCFWLTVSLALRTDEIFLLDKSFIKPYKNTYAITWPAHLMTNGIKAGRIRVVAPYAHPVLSIFVSFPYNPFLSINKARLNQFLTSSIGCTMQAARHCGAHYALTSTNSIDTVSSVLGHASILSAKYYIDFWVPSVSYKAISDLIIKNLLDPSLQ